MDYRKSSNSNNNISYYNKETESSNIKKDN